MAYDVLSAQIPRTVFIGAGTRGPFDFLDVDGNPIRVRDQTHVIVRRYSSTTDETGTPLTLGVDFTIANTDVDAVSISLTPAQDVLTSLQRLVCYRLQSIEDVLAPSLGGDFSGPAIGAAISILVEELQELRRDADRSVKVDWRDAGQRSVPLAPTSGVSALGRNTAGDFINVSSADGVDFTVEESWEAPLSALLGAGWSSVFAGAYQAPTIDTLGQLGANWAAPLKAALGAGWAAVFAATYVAPVSPTVDNLGSLGAGWATPLKAAIGSGWTAALAATYVAPAGSTNVITTGIIPTFADFEASGSAAWLLQKQFLITSYGARNAGAADVADVFILRRASYTGGTSAFVNSALKVQTIVDSSSKNAYEWAGTFQLTSDSADAAQHVALQATAIKNNVAGTIFGFNTAIVDMHADPTAGTVGAEIDVYAVGSDTNNARVILDLFSARQGVTGTTTVTYGDRKSVV